MLIYQNDLDNQYYDNLIQQDQIEQHENIINNQQEIFNNDQDARNSF